MKTPLLYSLVLCHLLQPTASLGDSVILPRGTENSNGDAGIQWLAPQSLKFQEVINSEELGPYMPDGALITGLSLRAAGQGVATFEQITVQISTTQKRADGLSDRFSSNIGPDVRTVYVGHGVEWDLRREPTGLASLSPVFGFSSPFYYHPGSGNLLLDVILLHPSIDVAVGAHRGSFQIPDGVSQVFTKFSDSFPPPFGGNDSAGPTIRLEFEPVPEPGSLWLAGLGILVVCGAMARAQVKAE